MTAPYWLNPHDPEDFPDVSLALTDPNGLLAVGGDLSVARLLTAYRRGIFPWYSEDQPILWWSPDPRMVLFPNQIHISKSLQKTLRKNIFELRIDTVFEQVMRQCAAPRNDNAGTWITEEMIYAYIELHRQGHAHSIECWQNNELVGGLYGVAIESTFFGESMFSRTPNASKVALVSLSQYCLENNIKLIDCQVESEHLFSMGAVNITRDEFVKWLQA